MRVMIAMAVFAAGASWASVPVRDGCSEDASVVANIQESDAIQIRHAVSGESVPCYAVSVMLAGSEVRGFISDNTLPAIQDFERSRAQESRIPIPAPPPPEQGEKKIAAPLSPVAPAFEPWSGVALNGRRVQIVPGSARATLVTFWAAGSGTARRFVTHLMPTESEFAPKGLKSYGLVEAADSVRAGYFLDDLGLVAPQALDRQRLALKYNADVTKGTTLVLDGANNVVAISSNLTEIRATVARLLSLE